MDLMTFKLFDSRLIETLPARYHDEFVEETDRIYDNNMYTDEQRLEGLLLMNSVRKYLSVRSKGG